MAEITVGIIILFALVSQRDNQTANRLLAVVLACVLYRQRAVEMVIANTAPAWMYRSTFPTELLATTTFYLYVVAMTTPGFVLQRKHAWYLLPFAFGLLWYLGFFIFAPPEYFEMGQTFLNERYARLILKYVIGLPFLFATLKQLLIFSRRLKDHLSDLSRIHLNWLRLLVGAALVLVSVDYADIMTGPNRPLWGYVPGAINIVVCAIGFFSVRHSAAFAQELEQEAREHEGKSERLNEDQLNVYKTNLMRFLDGKQPHLRPELRLSDLAEALSLKPYVLSEIIRRGFNTTFYKLINKRRVETAKALIADPKFSHLNLMGIGLESGFNSKSVFNEVFKKQTQMTPSEFRKSTL